MSNEQNQMSTETTKKKKMNPIVFWPPIILLCGFVIAGAVATEQVGNIMTKMLYAMADNFGWYINLLSLVLLVMSVVFIIRKYGDIKIGGKDAKPLYTIPQWCAMTICGGIGTGLLFWAMGEPIYHFAGPPAGAGVEAFSRGAGVFAVSQAMWDWSFVQYATYTIPAIVWAILANNKKMPLSYDSLVKFLFKRPIPWLATVFRIMTVFCICGCVSNSMGAGLLQIGGGLEAVFGIPQSALVWLIVALIIGVIFVLSCVSGLGNGLKKLSSVTMVLFFVLMVYTLITGNTQFITKITTEAIGDIIDNWGVKTTVLNAMAESETWSADWIVQYFASFIVYMPVMGMFFCRMAKGRTIRQFVLLNVGVPSVFCIIWIGIFGGQAIYLQYSGTMDIWAAVNESGMQATIFQILQSLPIGTILSVIFLVAICFSFCTLADPMSSALATVCVNGLHIESEPPKNLKIIIGVVITAMAYTSVATGGVNSIKGLFVLVGLLMSIPGLFCLVGTFKACKQASREKNSGCVEKEGDTAELLEVQE